MTLHPNLDLTTASASRLSDRPSCDLIPADAYTVAELTDIYNRTRVDYIVPMPMNTARLQAYIDTYDLDLTRSVVACHEGDVLGLAMLGVRADHTWITRLGVIPGKRRFGAGGAMMRGLIAHSYELGVDHIILEVIKNNEPAHKLFLRMGFRETRELLILRRPPGMPRVAAGRYEVTHGDADRALALLAHRRSVPSWLDEYSSLCKAGNLASLEVLLEDGSRGWMVYQSTVFQLGRLVLQTECGDPVRVARAMAHALHVAHPDKDTKTENLPALDDHLDGLLAMRYLESFRRIEMRREMGDGGGTI